MHTQQSHSFSDLPLFQSVARAVQVPGFRKSNREAPRFVRSVVDEAGLGRFVYLQGCSGRRYVFSAIKPEQVGLYDHAVFAFGGADGSPVELSCNPAHSNPRNAHEASNFKHQEPIFVHLLADNDGSIDDVIADLTNAVQ